MRTGRPLALIALASASASAAACGALVGVEDVTLGEDAGDVDDARPPTDDRAPSDAPPADGGGGGTDAPADVAPPPPQQTVALMSESSCVKKVDGTVYCWGDDSLGEVGDGIPFDGGTRANVRSPSPVVKVADAVLLAAGFNHACVIRQSGKVSCWGYNYFGQLGNGVSQVNASAPVDVMNLTDPVTIAGGTVFTCAINKGGAATCWGANYSGQLGNGSKTDSNVPVPVFNLTDAIAITGGDSHACALRKGGTVVCWGNNSAGQLGNGTTDDSLVPVPIPTLANVVAIQAGGLSTCALLQGGTISCWGSNKFGQLGNGSANTTPNPTPVTVATISDAVSLGGGFQHACAVRAGGGIACWGEGGDGEIGNGITLADANTPTPTPAAVQNVSNAANVSGGAFHTCASTKDLHVFCWGSNSSGQLGNGGTGKRSFVPVAVSGF